MMRRPSLTLAVACDLAHLAVVGKDWLEQHPGADPYVRARLERAILYAERLAAWRRSSAKPGGQS